MDNRRTCPIALPPSAYAATQEKENYSLHIKTYNLIKCSKLTPTAYMLTRGCAPGYLVRTSARSGPCSVEKSRWRRQKTVAMVFPVCFHHFGKVTARIFFNVYGRSGVPINWSFTLATLSIQTEIYFLFTVGGPSSCFKIAADH